MKSKKKKPPRSLTPALKRAKTLALKRRPCAPKLSTDDVFSSKKRKGSPVEGSLEWYREEWVRMSKHSVPDSMIQGLAQLSHENATLRKRLAKLEAQVLSLMLAGKNKPRSSQEHEALISASLNKFTRN